ncbi:MAG: M28 family peptidase [Acidobacteria bacterium]|nr:M28 family peptidase [Acidobacteriota bacterium]
MSSTKTHYFLLTLLVSLGAPGLAAAQETTSLDNRAIVEYLADDELEGRLTGSPGIRMAADYLVEQLEAIGAEPLPGVGGFRQSFSFTAGVTDTGTTIELAGSDSTLRVRSEGDGPSVRALSFSDTGRAEGQLVFAGYGLSVPETDDFGYDSYATLDVTDKIVVVFRYFPEDTEGELRATLARYAGLRYKALAARERGAAGLIVVTGPRSPNAGALVPLTFDTAVSDSRIVAATVDGELGAAIIESAGESIEAVQASLDTANPHVTGFDLPLEGVIEAKLERREATGHNVIGYLPPTGTEALDEPYVLLGAHYDHLGRGRGGDSLARGDEAGQIHNGADDNASGVAAVLSVGAGLAAAERGRGVILAFWSGEELGLLGSADFVAQAPVPMDGIAAYLNFDMVGRLEDDPLNLQAVGSSSIWTDLAEELNAPLGLDLTFVSDPYLPTDVGSLNAAEVPSLNFFTGSHEDYHRPTDDADTLDYEGLDRIVDLATAVASNLANRPDAPDFIRVEREQQRGGGATMRIFTGTIPDYTQEVEGLSLSGVIGGGPAEAAGLQGGDVIVGLAGQAVTNIYDYMYALDLLKVGEPSEVVFLRDGERLTTELIPRVRE